MRKCEQVCCRHVNNIICMVVATYILGLNFTEIKDIMRSHDENITKEKKKVTKQFFNLSHAPLNQIGLVMIKRYHWAQTTDWRLLVHTFEHISISLTHLMSWRNLCWQVQTWENEFTCFMRSMLELRHIWKNITFKEKC